MQSFPFSSVFHPTVLVFARAQKKKREANDGLMMMTVNFVDFDRCRKMRLLSLSDASIQPRADRSNFEIEKRVATVTSSPGPAPRSRRDKVQVDEDEALRRALAQSRSET